MTTIRNFYEAYCGGGGDTLKPKKEAMTKEEIGLKNGLPMHDPIQKYHINNAMQQYAHQENKAIHDKLQEWINTNVAQSTRIKELEDGLREIARDLEYREATELTLRKANNLLTTKPTKP